MSPRVVEQFGTDHDESPANGPPRRSGSHEPPQFTLGELLAFLTAMAVCMSLAATGVRLRAFDRDLPQAFFGATAVVAWGSFLLAYRRLNFRVSIILHWLGPALLLGSAGLISAWIALEGVRQYELHAIAFPIVGMMVALPLVACCGCAFGLLLSLPAFAVTIAILLVRTVCIGSGQSNCRNSSSNRAIIPPVCVEKTASRSAPSGPRPE